MMMVDSAAAADTIAGAPASSSSTSSEEKLKACLSILRRTPPGEAEENVAALATLLSSSSEDETAELLYQQADAPLGHAVDKSRGSSKPYIICDYNRDGDSYRSPWTNAYLPPLPNDAAEGEDDGGFRPPEWLRALEVRANELFDSYRGLYYGGGGGGSRDGASVSSVYLWDRDGSTGSGSSSAEGFAGAFLIKKAVSDDVQHGVREGFWNSVHVVDVVPSPDGQTATYGIDTSVTVSMDPAAAEGQGSVSTGSTKTNIAGTLHRHTDRVRPVGTDVDHIGNIGHMIEEIEIELRSNMDSLNIQKTRFVLDSIRSSSRSSARGATELTDGRGALGDDTGGRGGGHRIATMLSEAALARQADKLGSR